MYWPPTGNSSAFFDNILHWPMFEKWLYFFLNTTGYPAHVKIYRCFKCL